jgi:GT2 family glycosyltransferase
VDYSIVIPVFNKAEFTYNCLRTLRATLEGAGEGEVIVVDNASSDRTSEVLAQFPWVRTLRNERNLGFAAANNQGVRAASGNVVVLLNNDTLGMPGWLIAMLRALREPGVGIVGARLLFADRTIQHAGVVVNGMFFSRVSFMPWHYGAKLPANDPLVGARREVQIVTAACMATPRELYLELGGLDEGYWNGYEDVDYCFKVRERGLNVIYEPGASLYHFESQSGGQRFRRLWSNMQRLEERWHDRVVFDALPAHVAHGTVRRTMREARGTFSSHAMATPPSTLLLHGDGANERQTALEASLRANRSPIAEIVACAPDEALVRARRAMELRGDRYLALVRADATLLPGWLDELVAQVEAIPNVAAATYAPELTVSENTRALAADARCTLLALRQIPQHLELGDFDTLDGSVADLLLRALELGRGTRGAARQLAQLGECAVDASFERAHGVTLASVVDSDVTLVERALRERKHRERGLVSIVTLSWNAPEFTEKALASIARCTSEPYEVIVVDNGSDAPTRAMLEAIDDPHVRVIYNEINRGYAGGNNDGIAAASGEFIVLLNNDVIVTDGWLDGLLDPFDRMPALGVTAPRSNYVVGPQQLPEVLYGSEAEMAAFAAARRETWAKTGYVTDRAIGLCLCIDRRAIEQIGGLDESFGLGNFEDDDFCIRVRAAGYGIYVCDDVFIHHFGSRSFAANNVDYAQTMRENWAKFARKWGFSSEMPTQGYRSEAAIARGFDHKRHYVALPVAQSDGPERGAGTTFYAVVESEAAWGTTAEFVKRFARAFRNGDDVCLSIAALGDPSAQTIASRVEKIFARVGILPEQSADVIVSDEEDAQAWTHAMASLHAFDIATLDDRSPSALRRLTERARA